jgi:hypothetical protein
MEERFLFNGVRLQACHITPRHAQLASLIEAHLADAPLTLTDQTAVGTGVTAYGVIRQLICQIHLLNSQFIQDIRYGFHDSHLLSD